MAQMLSAPHLWRRCCRRPSGAALGMTTPAHLAEQRPCRIARPLRGSGFGVRPPDARDLAAAPVAPVAPDGAEHVTAQTVRRGIGKAGYLMHLGDGRARGAHGGR